MNARGLENVAAAVSSTVNRHRVLAAALALAGIGMAAAPASASTIVLQDGLGTGGALVLNSANVLLAVGAYDGPGSEQANGTYVAGAQVVQGVTFSPMVTMTSSTNYVYTNGSQTLSLAASELVSGAPTALSEAYLPGANVTNYFAYSNSAGSATVTTPSDSSSAALYYVMNNAIDHPASGSNPSLLTLTIAGLNSGQQYEIDLLQSALNAGSRTQYVQYNTTPSISSNTFSTSAALETTPLTALTGRLGYDSNDTVTANGSGDIVAYIYDESLASVFSGVVVSTVVPEPASLGLLALSATGLLMRRRRRARN